ncbi:MAG: PP2C family protein-serine/threonine phosphatase, partial [Mycobacteriales bacterium]
GATDVVVYLIDFERVVLQPVLLSPGFTDPILPDEDVAESTAGRAFRTGEPVVTEIDGGGQRVWVPLVERAERTGVLALSLPDVDEALIAECVSLGLFAGLMVRSFARITDLVHLQRRRRTMTLAAGMQWDLLPPLMVRGRTALACGLLEPAYEIAGDAFDYTVNDHYLDAALFDGMGHGVHATLLTTLAMGAYRHARRSGHPPGEIYQAVNESVVQEYGHEEFITGTLMRLDLEAGQLEWVNAGNPAPLLLRRGRVERELACPVSTPFGVDSGGCEGVARESLEPADAVLLFTDGVIESRSHDGDELGVDRLASLWEREASAGGPPEEQLRRLTRSIVDYSAGKLRDDATFLLMHWSGTETQGNTRFY